MKIQHIALGLVTGLAILFVGYRVTVSIRLQRQLDAYRALGYPVTGEELNEWYADPPEGKNAADEYLKAFAAYREDGIDSQLIPVSGGYTQPLHRPLPPDVLAETGRLIEINAAALSHLHRAARMSECRFPADFTDKRNTNDTNEIVRGLEIGFNAGNSARLLAGKVLYLRDTGDQSGAAQAILDSLSLGEALAQRPAIISYVHAGAHREMARQSFMNLISGINDLSEKDLEQLQRAFMDTDNREGLRNAIVGKFVDTWESIHMGIGKEFSPPQEAFAEDPMKAVAYYYRLFSSASKADIGYLARTTKELIRLGEVPYFVPSEDIESLISSDTPPGSWAFSSTATNRDVRSKKWKWIIVIETKRSALTRAAYTAAAVERYRIQNGQMPEALDSLVPEFLQEVPIDPFDGEPLRYNAHGKSYVVYSVGRNRADNGGYDFDNEQENNADVSFYVLRSD